MSRQDELEHYEHTEAQDLIRLLGGMRPPQDIRAPADFRAKVLRQVEQRRGHRGVLAWVMEWGSPVLTPALAAMLLISLGANFWWGLHAWAPGTPENQQAAKSGQSADNVPLHAYAFQAGIQSQTALGTLVAEHSALGATPATYGFTSQPRTRPYRVGLLYVEALAALRSDNVAVATPRLAALDHELAQGQAPTTLTTYMGTLRSLAEHPSAVPGALAALLVPFEPTYTEYAGGDGGESLTLFQFGAWLGNMSLAAAAGDMAALRQGNVALYFLKVMRQFSAPKGVLDALERIDQLLAQPGLSERDVAEVVKLVKKAQTLLG